ncbi:MAG: hypothetical protein JOZ81_32070 [Chloroflexi bacterium]|nr:hypothetical protein [Chloroflexota bacterium]
MVVLLFAMSSQVISAQEDQPVQTLNPPSTDSGSIDPNDPFGFNKPYPVADQSIANWWDRRTIDWRLQALVRDSYIDVWKVRTRALQRLDDSLLPTVMAGDALQRQMDRLQQLRSQGHGELLTVQHNYEVWEAVADEGVVYDAFLSKSHDADPRNSKALGPDSAPEWNYIAYRLQPFGDTWKVVDSVSIDNHDQLPVQPNGGQSDSGQDDAGN